MRRVARIETASMPGTTSRPTGPAGVSMVRLACISKLAVRSVSVTAQAALAPGSTIALRMGGVASRQAGWRRTITAAPAVPSPASRAPSTTTRFTAGDSPGARVARAGRVSIVCGGWPVAGGGVNRLSAVTRSRRGAWPAATTTPRSSTVPATACGGSGSRSVVRTS